MPGRETDHSRPFSAEIKKAWSYTSTPSTSTDNGQTGKRAAAL
jgi:hypothetical protein